MNKFYDELLKEAEKYEKDEFYLFQAEIGWQSWMNDYTDAEEGEMCSEKEIAEIDKILLQAFIEVHAI